MSFSGRDREKERGRESEARGREERGSWATLSTREPRPGASGWSGSIDGHCRGRYSAKVRDERDGFAPRPLQILFSFYSCPSSFSIFYFSLNTAVKTIIEVPNNFKIL